LASGMISSSVVEALLIVARLFFCCGLNAATSRSKFETSGSSETALIADDFCPFQHCVLWRKFDRLVHGQSALIFVRDKTPDVFWCCGLDHLAKEEICKDVDVVITEFGKSVFWETSLGLLCQLFRFDSVCSVVLFDYVEQLFKLREEHSGFLIWSVR
jgi:hypothetical protein